MTPEQLKQAQLAYNGQATNTPSVDLIAQHMTPRSQGALTLEQVATMFEPGDYKHTGLTYNDVATRMGAGPSDNPAMYGTTAVTPDAESAALTAGAPPVGGGAAQPQGQQASGLSTWEPGKALSAEELQSAIKRWQTPA